MTTRITIEACPSVDVEVKISDPKEYPDNEPQVFKVLKGESRDFHIYDSIEISIKEINDES